MFATGFPNQQQSPMMHTQLQNRFTPSPVPQQNNINPPPQQNVNNQGTAPQGDMNQGGNPNDMGELIRRLQGLNFNNITGNPGMMHTQGTPVGGYFGTGFVG